MTNGRTIKSFDDYNKLTNEQKEFYHFEQLSKIDILYKKMNDVHAGMEKKFSKKWVEKVVTGFLAMVLVSFAGGLIALVIIPTV